MLVTHAVCALVLRLPQLSQGTSGESLELQAQWLAAHLAGRLALPPGAAMRADVAAQRVWRSGALAHPLMSVGGSLARRHEQCYLEQLRQDLRSVSLAAASAPSAAGSLTAGHQSSVSGAATCRLAVPAERQAVAMAAAGVAVSGIMAAETALVQPLPAPEVPPQEEEDGEEFDEELENTFGVASPPSVILHAAVGRGGRRVVSTVAGQSCRGGRHSRQRRSDSSVDAGMWSARSAVLGGNGERSSAASASASACGSQVLSGSGERTSVGSTTSSASNFYARISSRISWLSFITGGAGGLGGGAASSPPLSPIKAPTSPGAGGKAVPMSRTATMATPKPVVVGNPPSLTSPTSPTTPHAARGESYDRAGSSINDSTSTVAASGDAPRGSCLVRPAARTRRGASAAAAVPAAALVPPAAGARARTAMNSSAVAAAAHAAAARARAVTQQVAAAMNTSAAARGRELGVGAGVGVGTVGDAVDGRYSAPTPRPQRLLAQAEGEDDDEAEHGPTRHTYSGPFHTPANTGRSDKATASERYQPQQPCEQDNRAADGSGPAGHLPVQLPEAAVTALPTPPPLRLPLALHCQTSAMPPATTSTVAATLTGTRTQGHSNGGHSQQPGPSGDPPVAAAAASLGMPTPRAVHVNIVRARDMREAGIDIDMEESGVSASTCAFASPTAGATCTQSQSPSMVLTYATSTGVPSPRSFRALQRNESNGSGGYPAAIGAAGWHGAAGAKGPGAMHAASLAAAAAAGPDTDGSLTGSGAGAAPSGLPGGSRQRLLAPVTVAPGQELQQRQLLQLQQAHAQPSPAAFKSLPSGTEGKAVPRVVPPPPLLLQLDEAIDTSCRNEPVAVRSAGMPAAISPTSKVQPATVAVVAKPAASVKTAKTPKGSSLAQALCTCLPFGQLKKSATLHEVADAAAAGDPAAEACVTSAVAQTAALGSERGGTGCAALASSCGLASRRPILIGGRPGVADGPVSPGATLAAGGPGISSAAICPSVVASHSSVTTPADPPQEGTPVAELIDEAERVARRMSRLVRQRRAVSSTGEDPFDADPGSNANSSYTSLARPVTRFSYNGAGAIHGAGPVHGAIMNLRRGFSSGLWGVGANRRSSGGGAGGAGAAFTQSTHRISGGGRSSRASSGAFRVSNCGGGSPCVSGPGGAGGGGGPYGSNAAADAASEKECGTDLSIWGDGAALDLMSSQIEALRTHLRDPRVVPFPSVGTASPPIASPPPPAPRSSRPSPSPSPRLAHGWPRSPSSATASAAALGMAGQPGLPASMPSPTAPQQQQQLQSAHSLPNWPSEGRPHRPQQRLQPYPSSGAPAGAGAEPLGRLRPVLRSHPGHPERQAAGGTSTQMSASAAQVPLPQVQAPPCRQATLPTEALTHVLHAPTAGHAAAAPVSRSLPATPQARAQPTDHPQFSSAFQRAFLPVASPSALEALPSIGSRVAPSAAAAAAAALSAAAAAATRADAEADWTPFSSFRNTAAPRQPELDSTCLATAAFLGPDGFEPGLAAAAAADICGTAADATAAGAAGASDADSRAVQKRRSVPDLRALQRLSTIPEHRRNQLPSANTLTESETETGSGIAGTGAGGSGLSRSFSGGISFTSGIGTSAVSSSTRAQNFGCYLGLNAESQTGIVLAAAPAVASSHFGSESAGEAHAICVAPTAAAAPLASGQKLGASSASGKPAHSPESYVALRLSALKAQRTAGAAAVGGICAGDMTGCLTADVAACARSGTAQGSGARLQGGIDSNAGERISAVQSSQHDAPACLSSPKATTAPTKDAAAAPPQLVIPVEPGALAIAGWPAAVSPHLPQPPLAALFQPSSASKLQGATPFAAAAAAAAARARPEDELPAGRRHPTGSPGVSYSTPPGPGAAASMLLLLPELPAGDGCYSSYPHSVPDTPTLVTPFSTAAAPCVQPARQSAQTTPLQPSQAPLPTRTSRTSSVAAAPTGLLGTNVSLAAGGSGAAMAAATTTAFMLRPRLTRQSTDGASMASLFQSEPRPSGIAASAVMNGAPSGGGGGAFSRSGGGAATGWLDSRTSAPARTSRKFLLGILGGGGGGSSGAGSGAGGGGVGSGLLSTAAENAVLPYRKRLSSGWLGPSLSATLPPSSPPLSPTGPSAGTASLFGGTAGSRRSLVAQQPRSSAAAAPARALAAPASGPPAPAARGLRATVSGAGFSRRSCLMEFDDDTEEAEQQQGADFPESIAAAAAVVVPSLDGRRSAPPLAQPSTGPPRSHPDAATAIIEYQTRKQMWPAGSSLEADGPNPTAAQRAHPFQHAAASSLFGEEDSWPTESTGGGVFMLSGVSPDTRLQPSLLAQAQTLAATSAPPVSPLPPAEQPLSLSPLQDAAAHALQSTPGKVLHGTYPAPVQLPPQQPQQQRQPSQQPDRASHDFGFRCYGNSLPLQPPDGIASSGCQAPPFIPGDKADTNLHSLLAPPPADLSPLPQPALPLRRATLGGINATSASASGHGPSAWSNYSSCGGGRPDCLLPGAGGLRGPFGHGPYRSAGSCGGVGGAGPRGLSAGAGAGGEEKRGSPAWLVRHASEKRQEQLVTQVRFEGGAANVGMLVRIYS